MTNSDCYFEYEGSPHLLCGGSRDGEITHSESKTIITLGLTPTGQAVYEVYRKQEDGNYLFSHIEQNTTADFEDANDR